MLELSIQNPSTKKMVKIDVDDGTYIGITGENYSQIMYALIGKQNLAGDIVLDGLSIKADYDEYMKLIAYISGDVRKRLDSTQLTINDYLDLSVMLRMENIDIDEYQKSKNAYLEFFSINKSEKLCDLDEDKLLLIEFVTLFLKKPKLILIDDFLSLLTSQRVEEMMNFLKQYLYPDNISIIASRHEEILKKITNSIYFFE